MAYQFATNNFEKVKAAFLKDTNLDANAPENVPLYIQYYHAQMADYQVQLSNFLLTEVGKIQTDLNNIRTELRNMQSLMAK